MPRPTFNRFDIVINIHSGKKMRVRNIRLNRDKTGFEYQTDELGMMWIPESDLKSTT